MDVCTIIAKNYLGLRPRARALARRAPPRRPLPRPHHRRPRGLRRSGGRAVRGRHARSARHRRLRPHGGHLQRARALDGGQAVAAALDARAATPTAARSTSIPTCASTRRWTRCSQAVRDHGLVLNPHNIEPMPRDGHKPNEQDILIAGAYNLGFIGIGSGDFADLLLDWWGERLEQRLHRRSRARLLRRPALDRPRAGDGGVLPRAARPRLQRRLLEPRDARRSASATAAGTSRATCRCGCSTSAASTPSARTCSPSTRTASGSATTPTSRACARLRRGADRQTASRDVADWPYTYDTSGVGPPARPPRAPALPRRS